MPCFLSRMIMMIDQGFFIILLLNLINVVMFFGCGTTLATSNGWLSHLRPNL